MEKVWGIRVEGVGDAGWKFQASSKTLFKTKEAAEAYAPSFVERMITEKALNQLERGTEKVSYVEYDLQG